MSARGTLAVLILQVVVFSTPAAGTVFVNWDEFLQGMAPPFTVSNAVTLNQGDVHPSMLTATDPTFLAMFPDSIPALTLAIGPPGLDAQMSMSLSQPAPPGTLLLVFDLDFIDERFLLSSGGTPLTLLDQLETAAGDASTFPLYDPGSGELTTDPSGSANNYEATLFDISGLSTVDILAFRSSSGFDSGLFVAMATVPEPPGCLLAGFFLAMLGLRCHRQNHPMGLASSRLA